MKAVIQQEPTGCGIAASAALAGVTYDEARAVASSLGIQAADQTLWSETHHVRCLLDAMGIAVSPVEQPFESWDALPDRALLSIKWRREAGRQFWHWVVFVRDEQGARVLDSKKALVNNTRRDFGRMRPKWSIAVLDQ
ncbi:hypothetical protein [Marinobacter xestospongiae]|uniref:Peptidase C39 family protein n=1 Tax=Marinobacter xestospongiae TaxID=994319 RepID=A0ABU3VY05_9GAMM|nr:hypothetical protein [Marinobacter xestospongiae]MDV2079169.1 hypothetical protein [Marinobacter xestospongiae]